MKIKYNNEIVKLKIEYLIEFLFLHVFYFLFNLIPLKCLWFLSKGLGILLWKVVKKYKNIAIDNLKKAFPEKNEAEIILLSRKVFINLMYFFFEFIKIKSILKKKNLEKYFKIEGLDILDKLLKKKKGVIAIASHFGNWEFEGALTAVLGYKLEALYFQQSNFLADHFFNSIRTSLGIKLIYKKFAFRKILKALQNNEIVGFLSDQDARKDGIFVRFFNRWTSTVKGPIYFALKTDAPVVLASLIRLGYKKYKFLIEEIPIIKTDNFEKDLMINTQNWSKQLEKLIRQYPEQWFWVHRRWKTKKNVS